MKRAELEVETFLDNPSDNSGICLPFLFSAFFIPMIFPKVLVWFKNRVLFDSQDAVRIYTEHYKMTNYVHVQMTDLNKRTIVF
jgi:hypothetical protein